MLVSLIVEMPKPPLPVAETMELPLDKVVISIGTRTDHWSELLESYPEIRNCSMDVAYALERRGDENPDNGTGFDELVRDKMREKDTWKVLWEVAVEILARFRILVVLCTHGKHRSLSLAYEIHKEFGCKLISPRNPTFRRRWRDPKQFLADIAPRLEEHKKIHGKKLHPLVGIWICKRSFNGPDYVKRKYGGSGDNVHVMEPGAVVVQMEDESDTDSDWHIGSVISSEGEVSRSKWYPPATVQNMKHWYYPAVQKLDDDLKKHWFV